jgi:hypothetical protein
MFAMLSIPLALYILYAAATGRVWIAQGPFARYVEREQRPVYFWACLGSYACLAVMLVTIF